MIEQVKDYKQRFEQIKTIFNIHQPIGYPPTALTGLNLPIALACYYQQFGLHEQLNRTQDYLLSPDELETKGDYTVFYSENQSVCLWAFRHQDSGQVDPAVYENYGQEEWHKTTDSISQFLLSMAYLQACISFEYSNEEYQIITEQDANNIAVHFTNKGGDSDLYRGVRFFGQYDDSIIAVMNNYPQGYLLLFSSESEQHFDEMEQQLEQLLSSTNEI